MVHLTREDWVEIYYALDLKRRDPFVNQDTAWLYHLDRIMHEIGPDGRTAADNGVMPLVCIWGDVQI